MTHCKRGLVAGILFLAIALTPGAAVAGPFEDGRDAAEVGDYTTALRLWRPLAEQGHADAQFNLGIMYEKGRGVPEDHAEAVKWYRLAAEQGYAKAQYNLGVLYEHGQVIPQDYVEAVKWYFAAFSRSIRPSGKTRTRTRSIEESVLAALSDGMAHSLLVPINP